MQNLERAGAGRSVSTQTGSMTGECFGPHSRRRNLLLCPVPLQPFNSGFPAFSSLLTVLPPGCLHAFQGASLPRSPGLPWPGYTYF